MSARYLGISLLTLVACCVNASGQSYNADVPGSMIDGNNSTLLPFSTPFTRMQQVYHRGALSTPVGPEIRFDRLHFRIDATNGAHINGQQELTVRMSTTPHASVDSLSPVFANNIGPDQVTVYSGNLAWFEMHHPGTPTPEPFTLIIPLQQPFFYRPANGHLLIDFTVGNTQHRARLDAFDRPGDAVASVFGSASGTSGTFSTLGLATYFEGIVVPEPSALSLLVFAGIGFFILHRKRRKP
jgi:hypothetical protein